MPSSFLGMAPYLEGYLWPDFHHDFASQIRRGQRPFPHPGIPDVPYLITLTRASSLKAELWPLALQQPLPTIPVPLRHPDPDVALNLAQAFNTVYEAAFYERSIDYNNDPPPQKLSTADLEWWQQQRQSFT